MEQVIILAAPGCARLEEQINSELRNLAGTLIDIKFNINTPASLTGTQYTAMIIYKRDMGGY